jgi:accessory gene regulator protein AgrB
MRLSLGAYVADNLPNNFFSFASFFLFIAVLPLFYAPETLAEKKIRELELKNYAKRAEIERRKYS